MSSRMSSRNQSTSATPRSFSGTSAVKYEPPATLDDCDETTITPFGTARAPRRDGTSSNEHPFGVASANADSPSDFSPTSASSPNPTQVHHPVPRIPADRIDPDPTPPFTRKPSRDEGRISHNVSFISNADAAEEMRSQGTASVDGDAADGADQSKDGAASEDSSHDDRDGAGSHTSGSTGTSNNSNTRRLKEILHAKIPFHVQVLLLMMVPISFVLVFSIKAVTVASVNHNYIVDHVTLIEASMNLADLMADERHENTMLWVYHNKTNATMLAKTRAALDNIRPLVDAYGEQVRDLCFESVDERIRVDHRKLVSRTLVRWGQLRTEADKFMTTTMMDEERATLPTQIDDVINALSTNEKAALSVNDLRALFLSRGYDNYLGALRDAGMWVLSVDREMTRKEIIQFTKQVTAFREYELMFEDVTKRDAASLTFLDTIHNDNHTKLAFAQRDAIGTANYSEYRDIEPNSFYHNFDHLFELMHEHEHYLVHHATEGRKERAIIVESSLLLIASILCSSAAAAFLVRKEQKSTETMKKSLEYSQKLNKAVQRYVPRRLLKLMGSSSILHVSVCDYSEIAVTMLFSDIRDFSSLSEVMTNPELFFWLQEYLSQTTRLTESRGGFVDKFVGDAVFTVFNQPANAVHCAIDMHVSADTINLNNLGKNKRHLLKIGVGIHHGVVCAGLLGDDTRLNATLISSDVNLASRLEGLTKFFGARILVSAAVANQVNLKNFASRRIGCVRTKGHTQHVEIFEVFQADPLGLREFKEATKERYENTIRAAEAQKTDDSADIARDELRDLVDLMQHEQKYAGIEDTAVYMFLENMDDEGLIGMTRK